MFLDLVKKNRSFRTYNASRAVTEEELCRMVECARFTPAAGNRQFLRYRLCNTPQEMGLVLSAVKWAALLPDWEFPPKGHEPTACIVICHDTTVAEDVRISAKDTGIAAQTILLAAAEMGLGGCMIGSFDPRKIIPGLNIPAHLTPVLVIPLGEPDEKVVLEDVPADGNTAYYRDAEGTHHVPKRTMDELIVR